VDKPSDNSYVRLAVASYENFVLNGSLLPRPDHLPEEMTAQRAGVFVSLHLNGRLRGCIGTISPVQPCIADEIIHNAVSAAAHDPRFEPVRSNELVGIECSVDVLQEPEEIQHLSQLDVTKYGVIVFNGMRRGLLLPNLDGVNTVEEQIAIAREKAGIRRWEPIVIQRFEVVRHL
jgi:AmmeMemoRadiSam system protein A